MKVYKLVWEYFKCLYFINNYILKYMLVEVVVMGNYGWIIKYIFDRNFRNCFVFWEIVGIWIEGSKIYFEEFKVDFLKVFWKFWCNWY